LIEIGVQRRVDRVGRDSGEQCVAVRLRVSDGLGRDVRGGAGPILDNKWLAEPFRKPLANQTR
jgi:hypothetical protein